MLGSLWGEGKVDTSCRLNSCAEVQAGCSAIIASQHAWNMDIAAMQELQECWKVRELTLGVKMAVVRVTTTGRCTRAHRGMDTCQATSP